MKASALLALFPVVALAQNAVLSSTCQTAVETLANDTSIQECLAINAFVTSFKVLTTDLPLVASLIDWQNAFCAAPNCDNATLATATEAIYEACLSDVGLPSIVQTIVANQSDSLIYGIKDALCLRDATIITPNSTDCTEGANYCVDELIGDLSNSANITFSFGLLGAIIDGTVSKDQIGQSLRNLDGADGCTECNVALYHSINDTLTTIANVSLDNLTFSGIPFPTAFDAKCGQGFVEMAPNSSIVSHYSDYCPTSSNSTGTQSRRLMRLF